MCGAVPAKVKVTSSVVGLGRAQVAEEQALGLAPLPHMKAQSLTVVCEMEASVIQAIALPLWEQLASCFPALTRAVLRMGLNYNLYRALSRLPDSEIAEVRVQFCLAAGGGRGVGGHVRARMRGQNCGGSWAFVLIHQCNQLLFLAKITLAVSVHAQVEEAVLQQERDCHSACGQ